MPLIYNTNGLEKEAIEEVVKYGTRFRPLPKPVGRFPYHIELEKIIGLSEPTDRLVFHCVGDTGGLHSPQHLFNVSRAMSEDLPKSSAMFFLHLGDVVYNHGEIKEYYNQFYLPYKNYGSHIIALAGNHDGDTKTENCVPLEGWTNCFMSEYPHIDPISGNASRFTLTLPNVYFTLECPFATIVCLYSNVPEFGIIDEPQLDWFVEELRNAPKEKALIVAMHQPVFSFDINHGKSEYMAQVFNHAINESRRIPNLVLSGHVHNYQRIHKTVPKVGLIPFIVAGFGGHYMSHGISVNIGDIDYEDGSQLVFGEDKMHGFLTIEVNQEQIEVICQVVEENNGQTTVVDRVFYRTSVILLPDDAIFSLH